MGIAFRVARAGVRGLEQPPSQDVLRQRCSMQESDCSQGFDPWASNFGCDIPAACAGGA